MKKIILLFSIFFILFASKTYAQTTTDSIDKARVLNVLSSEEEMILDDFSSPTQMIEVQILTGEEKGEVVSFENDYIQLKKGDNFFIQKIIEDDFVSYKVTEVNRTSTIVILGIICLFLLLLFGGMQGVRGLLSLGGSLLLIIYFLMPNILGGMSPVFVSVITASLIIILGSYITHGFNRTTTSAVLSMILTVIITGVLAKIVVDASRLSGNSEEAFFLNLKLGGEIDLIGILMGGIIIGLLGVLYDVAISQAISVEELFRFVPNTNSKVVYKRAIRMGREHIGALVNTLAIAYVGASLPLFLLLFSNNQNPFILTLNQEIIAAEIIRTLVGTIGIILAVPITTLIAIYMLTGKIKPENDPNHHFDGHSHGHKH